MTQQTSGALTLLVIATDPALSSSLPMILGADYRCDFYPHPLAAVERLHTLPRQPVLLLEWGADQTSNQTRLSALTALANMPPVIVLSWDRERESALAAARLGASDFLPQPLDAQELRFALTRAFRTVALRRELSRARQAAAPTALPGMLGEGARMRQLQTTVGKMATVCSTVLITGESGTGKELAARAIHRMGPRAQRPFVAFSVCDLPESLLEAELFGYERGAFTGALQSRAGRFEEAQGGTIFLDEIGDLALPLQSKLLRVLQERTVRRLGARRETPLDVRVICATHRNLPAMVRAASFREDLFFRISVLQLDLPPLRERIEEIPVLAEAFVRDFAVTHGKSARGMSPGYLRALLTAPWPGNVRQLQNVIERSVVMCDGNCLEVEDLPPELQPASRPLPDAGISFHSAVQSYKRELVRAALRSHRGNKLRAARSLAISRGYLHRILHQLGLDAEFSEPFAQEKEPRPQPAPARLPI